MDEITSPHNHKESLSARIALWSILTIIFLIPLLFIPTQVVLFPFGKALLLFAGIIICFCASIISRLKDGNITLTRNYLFIALAALPITYALSAIFSQAKRLSIMGTGFEVGSLVFIVAVSLLAFFIAFFFSDKKSTLYAYVAFLIPIPLVALFQFIRLLAGPDTFSFGVLNSATSTLLGGWNDLGIYFGAAALFTFISLELLNLEKRIKIGFISILVISIFFLSVVNFTIIWYILAAFALIFFVYNFSFNKSSAHLDSPVHSADSRRTVPFISFAVIIVCVIFILLKGNLYTALSSDFLNISFLKRFAIENIEVRPSWGTTAQVAQDAFIRNPVFGAGPNRFVNEWLQSKPVEINNTIFWGTDFNYGIGLIPTFLITTGIVGTVAWIAFFVLFLYMGFKTLFTKIADPFLGYVSISSFAIAFYLWIFAFIYVPSPALLVLTFFFTGLFMSSLIQNKFVTTYKFSFIRDPRTSFVSVLVFIILLLGVLVASYSIGRKFIASVYFNKALIAANVNGNIDQAESHVITALQIAEEDQYYRALVDINLLKINALLSKKDVPQEVLQNDFRRYLAAAQGAAQTAVNHDKTDYQNWLTLGKVYESIVPLNVEGSYESAQSAYAEARKLNPKSPSIVLVIARLDVAHKDIVKAKNEISQALALKPDYTDAIYFLSQIQVSEGDIKSAIASTEAAAYLNPRNSGIYFQLGLLKYDNKDYVGSEGAFKQAVTLTPNYANAKYFLGLSLSKQGKVEEAIEQFQDLATTNPDNQEIALILSNLKGGREPFANVKPPLDDKPEQRSTPPVAETKKQPDTSDR